VPVTPVIERIPLQVNVDSGKLTQRPTHDVGKNLTWALAVNRPRSD
jgi:hypothetical protein